MSYDTDRGSLRRVMSSVVAKLLPELLHDSLVLRKCEAVQITAMAGSAEGEFGSVDGSEPIKLNIILKADSSGSVEAIKSALGMMPQV